MNQFRPGVVFGFATLMVTLAVVVLPATALSGPPPCDPSPGLHGQDVQVPIDVDGEIRYFTMHIPVSYNCRTKVPLVIGVHGYTGSGSDFENNTAGMFDHVEANGYIGVFPDALESSQGSGITSFNDIGSRFDEGPDGPTCTNHAYDYPPFENCGPDEKDRLCTWGTACSNDVGFFSAMIDFMKAIYAIDEDRIYMIGFSQGGQTVASLTCLLEDDIAAAVPLHGLAANGFTCGATEKVSLMQIRGTRDNWVRLDGRASADGLFYEEAIEAAADWASAQSCDLQTTEYPTNADHKSRWQCVQHANCATGAQIVNCSWHGGHQWPRNVLDGNFGLDVIWEFLQSQSK